MKIIKSAIASALVISLLGCVSVQGESTSDLYRPTTIVMDNSEEANSNVSFVNATDIEEFWNRYHSAIRFVNEKGDIKYGDVSKEIMLYGEGVHLKNAGTYWYDSDNSDIVCSLYQTSELKVTDTDINEIFFSVCGFDTTIDDMETIYSNVRDIFYVEGGNGTVDGITIASYQATAGDKYVIVIGNDGIRPKENNNTTKALYNKVGAAAITILKSNLVASNSLKVRDMRLIKETHGKKAPYDVYYVSIEYSATNAMGGEMDATVYIAIDPKTFEMHDEMQREYKIYGFEGASIMMEDKHGDALKNGIWLNEDDVLELVK